METFYINLEVSSIGKIPISMTRTGRGPQVLLVHGWLDTSHRWKRLSDALASDYEVWTLDLPGFGQTPPIPSTHATLAFYTDILANLIDHVSEGSGFHGVVGHSMGGLLLLGLIKSDPIAKHIVVCGAPAGGISSIRFLTDRQTFVASCLKLAQKLPKGVRTSVIKFGQLCATRSWHVVKREPRDLSDFDAPTAASLLKEICGCSLVDEVQPAPTHILIARGQHDPFVSHTNSVRLADTLGAEFYEFQGAHHSPVNERSEHFNRVIQQFFGQGK